MKKILLLAILSLSIAGCVYEFIPEIEEIDYKGLVVEGDIIIGDTTRVTLSAVESLSGGNRTSVKGWVWVEDDAGREYHPESSDPSSSFKIDLTKASPDLKYRMRIRLLTPVTGSTFYSSAWKEVQKAPVIDDISYTYEKDHPELDRMVHMSLSLSSPDGSGCFRWDFEEIWEFHAQYMAQFYFDPVDQRIKSYNGVPPYYNCWAYSASTQAGLAIAKSTGGERIEDWEFYQINRRALRLQTLYYLKLKARNISEECYEYLHSIEVNSTSTGSLSQPDPSQIVGNITSDTDPLEVVYGYIEVSRIATKSIYLHSNLYIPPQEFIGDGPAPPPVTGTGIMTALEAYESGLRLNDTPSHWVDASCVECIFIGGGTKNKPSFWPTSSE